MTHADEPLPPAEPPLVQPGELPRWVLLDDARLLVLDKPGWLVVHPSKNGPWSSLAGAVREGLGLETIRFIYRLDRETSGVVILAKDEATGSRLQKAMGKRQIGKAYVTILEGELNGPVTVDQWLGQDLSAGVTVKQKVVPPGTRALVLTGMGADGAKGALALKKAGVEVWAEAESSAVVFGMPEAAIKAGAVARTLPLEALGPSLARALKG